MTTQRPRTISSNDSKCRNAYLGEQPTPPPHAQLNSELNAGVALETTMPLQLQAGTRCAQHLTLQKWSGCDVIEGILLLQLHA
jgi:hypothetical protein